MGTSARILMQELWSSAKEIAGPLGVGPDMICKLPADTKMHGRKPLHLRHLSVAIVDSKPKRGQRAEHGADTSSLSTATR